MSYDPIEMGEWMLGRLTAVGESVLDHDVEYIARGQTDRSMAHQDQNLSRHSLHATSFDTGIGEVDG